MSDRTQERVYEILHQIPDEGLPAVKRLFCTELNYDHASLPLSSRGWPARAQSAISDPPRIFARHKSEYGAFDIIYAALSRQWKGRTFPLSVTAERAVIDQLLQQHPYALFVFSDLDEQHWHLVNVRYDEEAEHRRIFRRIALGPHEHVRTAAELLAMVDLSALARDYRPIAPLALQQRHDDAFDVEAVTSDFFSDYRRIFEQAEEQIEGLKGEERRLFTQRLFNRLLFIRFLERKGWLTFDGREDYLCALWKDYQHDTDAGADDANFHRDRLTLLFFSGLNNVSNVDMMCINRGGFLADLIGRVPYLNGGLFEKQDLDRREGVHVPDTVFGPIFDELIYHYNFTVTESTPLDIEVAVDPEMLGKIFEELVTGRHETGSYYTPKAVVSFMCREALKGYLRDTCPRENDEVIGAFVDEREAGDIRQPEAVLSALQTVRVCDHACGSGAYLVGMLHELVDLRQALFTARGVDPRAVYDKKLEIIQHNLYGVDIDPFAVNIARLRLWLSLTVDFEGETPPPLPNLEFKIEVGDSLTGPAPGQLQPDLFHHQQVQEYFRLKGEFLRAHGPEKTDLRREIEVLQEEIASWAHGNGEESEGFDWAVTFAEVFAGPAWDTATLMGAMTEVVNTTAGQMELAPQEGQPAGFDIVLTNPPYVRQELLDGELKETLKKRYPEVYRGTADLYVYFYARALHLLREGGVGSFISSNKWLRAGYGKKLRRHIASEATVDAIVDFGDLPLFEATAYPMIIVFQDEVTTDDHRLKALEVHDLAVVDQLSEVVKKDAWTQPQRTLDVRRGWTLVQPESLALLDKVRRSGMPLEEGLEGRSYRGVTTGLNDVFVIDEAKRNQIVRSDATSAEIIEPWLRGRDVKRWQIEPPGLYVIFTRRGVDIDKYPAIKEYLLQFQDRLMPGTVEGRKAGSYEWYEIQDSTAYYAEFKRPKIIWAKYGIRPAFAYDGDGYFCTNTVFIIATDRLELLGFLNSRVVQWFAQHTFNIVRGGYVEWIPTNVAKVPVPELTGPHHKAIGALVRKLLDAEGEGLHVKEWERELNALVYEVYRLTEEEIAIVERETTSDGGNTR